jgi:hypothetical protein
MKEYEEACRKYDPDHPKKHTRSFWGNGPDVDPGRPTYEQRPRTR